MDFKALRWNGRYLLRDVEAGTLIPVHRLSRIENGLRPRPDEAVRLARFYGVPEKIVLAELRKAAETATGRPFRMKASLALDAIHEAERTGETGE